MQITQESHFETLKVNQTTKGSNGFYTPLLNAILQLQKKACQLFAKPLCAHLTIDNPVLGTKNKLNQELTRWYAKEAKANDISHASPLYFSCLETTPRSKNKHLHLLIWFQATKESSFSLKILSRRLEKLSNTKTIKINRRKDDNRSPVINQTTGEIETTSTGRIKRLGSAYYHNLATEFDDAFERCSYLAKVFSKNKTQERGVHYSHSRLTAVKDS